MRTISALLVALAACGGGAVCAGCSDDAGPVDALPESFTLIGIAGTGSASTPECASLFVPNDFTMVVRNLSTACTCFATGSGRGDCDVSNDVISCDVPSAPNGGVWTADVSDDVVVMSLVIVGGCTASIMATVGPAPL